MGEPLPDRYVLALLISFAIAVSITPVVRELARYRSLLDAPNERSSHRVPVPRLGGMAILLGSAAGGLLLIPRPSYDMALIGSMSLLMATMGLVDDLRPVGVLPRYLAQLVAAGAIATWMKPTVGLSLPFWDVGLEGILSMVVSAVFILAVVNALNFLDGIDGIAAGVAMTLAIAALLLNNFSLLAIMVPLIASLAGFLCWNINPASIFMGDGGSQFVGFVIAVGLLYRSDRHVDFVPVLICLLPLFADTGFTLLRRLFAGQNVFQAHREHLYQRMVRAGYAHRSVANLYYVLTVTCVLLAYGYRGGGPFEQSLILLGSFLASLVFIVAVFAMEQGLLKISIVLPSAQRDNIVVVQAERNQVDEAR